MDSFASRYHALFLAGALFVFASTILTWHLVSPTETQPVSARSQCAPDQYPVNIHECSSTSREIVDPLFTALKHLERATFH